MPLAYRSLIAFWCFSVLTSWLSVPLLQANHGQKHFPVNATDPGSHGQQADDDGEEPLRHDLFLRVRRDRDDDAVAMETSITRYIGENSDGDTIHVDLIGVVHIGEKEYYETLNEIFEQYDAVLYELVAPEGTVIPKGGREMESMNPVAFLQQAMQSTLDLEFQLDLIDYTVENFVHADMTPEEFLESMENNDESFLKMAAKALAQGMSMSSSGRTSDLELMMALFADDREIRLRKIMAEEMQSMESGMMIFEGKDGSTIINHRNRKAMTVMESQIKAGKKRMAIFYGAGHLADMDQLLRHDYDMKRGGQYWLPAWKLR